MILESEHPVKTWVESDQSQSHSHQHDHHSYINKMSGSSSSYQNKDTAAILTNH